METKRGGSYDAVYSALCRRIISGRLDLVTCHGIEAVMAAIDQSASRFESITLDEIGTSDVSCWIHDIETQLMKSAVAPLPAGTYVEIQTPNGGHSFGTLTRDYLPGVSDASARRADGSLVIVPAVRVRAVVRRYPFTMTAKHRETGKTVTVYVACLTADIEAAKAELERIFGRECDVTRVAPRVAGEPVDGTCEGWTSL